MYFNSLGTTKYDDVLITDILKRIVLASPNLDKSSLVEQYTIIEGETPESVSDNYYQTTNYYWLILMMNNIKSRYFDWPMSSQELQQYVASIYGNKSSLFFSDDTLINVNRLCDTSLIRTRTQTPKTFKVLLCDRNLNKLEIEKIKDTDLEQGVYVDLLNKNNQLLAENILVSRIVFENEVALHHINFPTITNRLFLNQYINGNNLPEHVSNLEYETELNEKKRNIFLLKKTYVLDFVNAFKLAAETQ